MDEEIKGRGGNRKETTNHTHIMIEYIHEKSRALINFLTQ